MPENVPEKFENVAAVVKANVYFDGKVVSHTILLADGSKKTLGVIHPGIYHFGTGAPERMDIVAGSCRYKPAGKSDWQTCAAGAFFRVAGKSSFDIAVDEGIVEYVCTFK